MSCEFVDQKRSLQSSMQSLQGQKRWQLWVCMIALHNISLLGVLKAFVLQEFYAKLKSLSNDMWLQASIVRVHHDTPAGVKSMMSSGQLRCQETQAVMSNFLQSWKTEMDVTRI